MTDTNKDIKDSLEGLPEAPASVTYSITSRDGFNALFTLRENSGEKLLQKMAVVEDKLLALQYKPQLKPVFGAKKEVEYVEGKVCPKDGGRLIAKVSSTGKPFHKCENGKWDFASKKAIGCDYVDWLNPTINYNKKEPYSGKTLSVEEYENLQPGENINL